MKKLLPFLIVMFCGIFHAQATHIKAGEITYQFLSGKTYKVTVTTYSNTLGTSADDCEVTVLFGDGDSAIVSRSNGYPGTCASPALMGVPFTAVPYTKLNIYETTHTYHGDGIFHITCTISNRNGGTCNMLTPGQTRFSLRSDLIINPFLGANTSSVLLNPPLDKACIGECFEHNPQAYDVNGDSLYYYLDTCYQAPGIHVYNWSYPPNMGPSSIDHRTGDLLWCSPTTICQYNIAIVVEEWKLLLTTHTRYFAGSVLRDMQIDAASCMNTPPAISSLPDTCIVAGTPLSFNVTASDAEANTVTLSASGGPFLLTPGASFPTVSAPGSVTGTFSWMPDCAEVQLLPYLVTFKSEDSDPALPLVNFESVFIRVIAPAPTGLTATPGGSGIIVSWSPPACAGTGGANPLKGYYIYRKESCDPWVHSFCETGVPAYTGYTLAGTVNAATNTFTDNNGGLGLLHGIDYSYIVVAYYSDGSQSYASGNVCAHLVRDVPIITNVSVLTTGAAGAMWVHWVKPLGISTDLDTIANPGPYEYRLMKATGQTGTLSFSPVPGASYTYPAYWQLSDTGFVAGGINTLSTPYTYRVDFYCNGIFKGSTHTASSVLLSSSPGDNKVTLTWKEYVPWINNEYFIYKEVPSGSSTFVLLDSTTTQTYIDAGLVNGATYCYKVQSRGEYSDPALPRPLYNMSQIKCETPVDLVPPCQPNFTVTPDCGIMQDLLTWTNPNTYCSDDAVQYNIYFARTTDADLMQIATITDINTTSYTHLDNYDGIPSIAGCYAVTAVDSFGNESPIVNKICVDNCPVYELPNVFTPNGDNVNDLFTALPYRYVKDVDIKIYDRWGLLMFETTDPDVRWDGKSKDSKKQCVDGTYFYLCTVNEIRVEGITPRILKGFVQLINTKTPPNH
jgi:gliding motility-associated-like protein